MNKITVNFTPCEPAPAKGYEIKYRVAGSLGPYTDTDNFFVSPAVFYDHLNPAGTEYEGYVRSDCGGVFGNPEYWTTGGAAPPDNGSCGTSIHVDTMEPTYKDLGFFILHVEGAPGVELGWETFDRPNRFTFYDNGGVIKDTGWKGFASYPGPWGASLSTAESGTIFFTPVAGHEYKLKIEVGPADPGNIQSDSFNVNIFCSPVPICRLHEFSVFGGDGENWHVTGIYCDGTVYDESGIVGDGPPANQCLQVGSTNFHGTPVVLINDTNLCP